MFEDISFLHFVISHTGRMLSCNTRNSCSLLCFALTIVYCVYHTPFSFCSLLDRDSFCICDIRDSPR